MKDLPDILREYRVKIIPAEDAGPQAAYPDNLGFRTKFGDRPDAIQPGDDEAKVCKQCFGPCTSSPRSTPSKTASPTPNSCSATSE